MNIESAPRTYRQGARAIAAKATGERILAVFRKAILEQWFEEIRLDDIAKSAGVTVQTVIRRFGSKDGLLKAAAAQLGAEIRARRVSAVGNPTRAIQALAKDYEASGDLAMRMLAQEVRHAPIKKMTDIGREGHREWIAATFHPQLADMTASQRRKAIDQLVAASDVYVWKLFRRDMARSCAEYRSAVLHLVMAILPSDQN
jgi:AcrR family transcriptional regulator